MNRNDHARLSHMIEAAQDAQSFLSGKSLNELQDSRQLAFAVVRALEIVGEAASQISQELRDRYPNIKWRDIISMRNKLIHAYFDINYNIVWTAVQEDIPKLIPELQKILGEYGS